MSTSDLYILNQKSVTHFAWFQNGWGSGPLAWDFIGKRHIADQAGRSMMDLGYLRRVWQLADDPRLTRGERIAMMLTFDHAYVPRASLQMAGEACREFNAAVLADPEFNCRTNNWAAIGDALIRLADMKLSRHARGACLSCTSVSDAWAAADKKQLANAWPIQARAA